MGKRHDAREKAVQFLFQCDFNSEDIDTALQDFWELHQLDDPYRAFAEKLIHGVIMRREELDERLKKYADNWDPKRMGAVDRNVMRMALFEMFYRSDIPPVVSINEAVDIAKSFSSYESGRFVNGILDRALNDLEKPQTDSEA